MAVNKSHKILLVFFFLNLIYFIVGFVYQHDFSNGGKIDFEHIYGNFLLFKNSSLFELDWAKYESTSLPLHYLITKFLIPENNIFVFKLYTFILSLLCVPLFYITLKIKLNIKKIDFSILLISSIILLSSPFRTDGYFGLEENIGFFILFICLIFYFLHLKTKEKKYIIPTVFFSCLVFYTRQTYAFVSIITFFYFLDKNNLISFKNFKISFIYFIFLVPSLYFFFSWGSVLPVDASFRLVGFQFYSIPYSFGMFIIFTLPFYLYNFTYYLKQLNLKNSFFLTILFIVYALTFWALPINNFGGGPLAKLLLFDINFKIIFFLFSFLGILTIYDLSRKNLNILIFALFFVFIYMFADKAFYSYLDPLMFIIIVLLSDKFIKQLNNKNFSLFLFSYFFILHFSWIYYFHIYLDGVIR